MSVCTGLIVANIYYAQPLVILISREFGVAESAAGTISFCTQLGYALGLLFLVPLGDKLERRRQILVTAAVSIAALAAAALSPNLLVLQVACVLIGCTSIVPQLILPLAAHLARPEKRGSVVGIVMSGLLVGILLSRTVSGFVGAWLGWRAMFWIAAGLTGNLLFFMRLAFPQSRPSYTGNYATLMRSLLTLVKEQPLLREASAINALTFVSFGMFWTTMVLHLSGAPFHYHSDTIGLFGLAAAAGALLAPLIGGIADRGNPRVAIGYGLAAVAVSMVVFFLWGGSVAGMLTGIVLLDLGQQSVHVSNQARIYTLMPEARNRINTVYMTISFLGTASGSALGLFVWDRFGWPGICIMGLTAVGLAFTVYASTYRRSRPRA
ncbi:MAG: transporter [Flaviaesturariibacter sp.]|nr:transporter [Flaviaesturariibacter sp.]